MEGPWCCFSNSRSYFVFTMIRLLAVVLDWAFVEIERFSRLRPPRACCHKRVDVAKLSFLKKTFSVESIECKPI